jgi:hypothetical protein
MKYVAIIIGVAVLIAGFAFSDYYMTHDEMVHDSRRGDGYRCELLKEHMGVIAQHLKSYYSQNNRYPTNDEGLTVLKDLQEELAKKHSGLPPPMGTYHHPYPERITYYYRINKEEMVPYEDGILSPMLEPFIYENRRGLPENLLVDSPVNRDKNGDYSLKVDDGIYLYSSSSVFYHDRYSEYLSDKTKYTIYAVGFALLALIIGIVLIKARRIIKGILILVSILTGIYIPNMSRGTCYTWTLYPLYERPDMIGLYNSLLEKYRQRGVINDATYQKSKTSIEKINKLIEDRKLY